MTTVTAPLGAAADVLWEADRTVTAIAPVTARWPELDADAAYRIQDELLQRRIALGQTVVGLKLGLTSRAKQRRMGIAEPILAWLTDAMVLPAGIPVPRGRFIQPRAEPELVLLTEYELRGPGMTAARAWAAVGAVLGGIEIIDSRFRDYRFTLPDVIADNASSGAFVLGSVGRTARDLDSTLEAVLLEVDGKIVDSATGAVVLGQPGEALAWAVNQLGARGHRLPAGSIVLTGGMTDAVPIAGTSRISAHFSNLGSITISEATTRTETRS
ncbi:fumarylacetoacetate hydrolase family protein [Nocardia sp. JMUB6875]|uniref:2-keto-4-pentenoate hydratase n=1 Tax=Nocardia sp. JMUB6875 TaxID=3158170 RepID=UPI0032E675BC